MKPTLYYDATLKDIAPSGSGKKLVIEYQGKEILLTADPVNAQQNEKRLREAPGGAELVGLARLIRKKSSGGNHLRIFYRFDPYLDQTLRRAFDLDDYEYLEGGCNMNCIGWRNAKNPGGFLAPRGIIPGKEGGFVSDNTEKYQVAVPFEFVSLAARMKTDPESLIRNFIADACGLQSRPEMPRADELSNRGSEATRKARDYLRQAWNLKKDFF